jgi:hypothetical protein
MTGVEYRWVFLNKGTKSLILICRFWEAQAGSYALLILLAKCVKNARDHIKRDAALEMEAGPPKPACRRRLQTTISCVGQSQGGERYGKGATWDTATIRLYAVHGINAIELNRFAVAAIHPSRNPFVQ